MEYIWLKKNYYLIIVLYLRGHWVLSIYLKLWGKQYNDIKIFCFLNFIISKQFTWCLARIYGVNMFYLNQKIKAMLEQSVSIAYIYYIYNIYNIYVKIFNVISLILLCISNGSSIQFGLIARVGKLNFWEDRKLFKI